MKTDYIIAAALLLLTTTAAAQDRHTETAPDTRNLQTAPNAEQPANRSKRCNGSLDLLEKGRDTLAAKKPRCFPIPWNPSPT